MRIVHVTSVHRWNDVRIYHKMCRYLVMAGYEVHLVAPAPNGPLPDGNCDGVVLHLVPHRAGRVDRVLGTARDAAKTALALKPDIAHLHDPELLPHFATAKARHGVQVVYDVHEDHRQNVMDRSWAPRPIRPMLGWGVGFIEDWSKSIMSAIVAATPRIAQRFTGHRLVALVQNYPDLESDPLTGFRMREPVTGRFAYVGGISAGRCIVEILGALDRVGSPATLALAGVWERPDLAHRLQGHPAWPLVQEHGFLGRVAVFELLRRAQAGLVLFQPLKNHIEAQPNKMFEYMLAGLPLIASDFPLWRSIVRTEGCGLLVDPMSPDDIAGAMRWVLGHPEGSLEMGMRGRQAVLTRYNWSGEFSKLLGLYEQLSDESPRK